MKKIVNFDVIEDVPDNFLRCSVCGKYYHPDEFKNEDDVEQTRTNCTSCYKMPWENMQQLKKNVEKFIQGLEYKKLDKIVTDIKSYKKNSISVNDMMVVLKQLPKGSRLYISQDGYYADGKFADIYLPEGPNLIDDINYYTIGHSNQNS